MKENQKMLVAQGKKRLVGSLFRDLKTNKKRILRKQHWVSNQWVWLSAMKLESGDITPPSKNDQYC